MKHPQPAFAQLYRSALRAHLTGKSQMKAEVISKIGGKVHSSALPMLEFAKFHESFLVMDLLPRCPVAEQAALIRKAGSFFAAVATTTTLDVQDTARLGEAIESLSVRTVELAAANLHLSLEIKKCRDVEAALRKSENSCQKALENSEKLREKMRSLSRQILTAHEDERKKISRDLHDVLAQTLVGINIRLATLKTEAGINTKKLARNISLTQKLVTKSAAIVTRFARELRPPALDDLGLISSLHSFMRAFTKSTGVQTHLTFFKGVEDLNVAKRTILYRVAQEALTNVGRHACASNVKVTISRQGKIVRMEVADDGRSFKAEQTLPTRGVKHLGLLCMRERVEMIGGVFEIESSPGNGTKIIASIPVSKATENKWKKAPVANP
jgi:signal transduction histidine kinase